MLRIPPTHLASGHPFNFFNRASSPGLLSTFLGVCVLLAAPAQLRAQTVTAGCVSNVNGGMRAADSAAECRTNETFRPIASTPGPAGPTGPTGATGPTGPTGPVGPGLPENAIFWTDIHGLRPTLGALSIEPNFTDIGMRVSTTNTAELQWVGQTLAVPPGYFVTGARVCYRVSDPESFLSQVRFAQVTVPPGVAFVKMDDPTDRQSTVAECVDSSSGQIDPEDGAILFSLRFKFTNTAHFVQIYSAGARLQRKD